MNQANPKHIQKTIKDYKLRIKKKYGQNFLIDQNILNNIVKEALIDSETVVIEIGPGLGSLTEGLLEKAKAVLAYEIDADFIPILKNAFPKDNLHLIHDDFLKRSIDDDLNTYFPNHDKFVLVANLPYYITTPILMKCLEETSKIKRLVLMMQLEVARRMTAKPSTKEYNALSLAVSYRCNTYFAFKVPKTVFIPSPEVDSAVIRLELKSHRGLSEALEDYFFKFIKYSFKQRRKTLLNNLSTAFEIDKTQIIPILEQLQIPIQARAESLSLDTFIELTRVFYLNKIQ